MLEIHDAQLKLRRAIPATARERASAAAHSQDLPEDSTGALAEATELALA